MKKSYIVFIAFIAVLLGACTQMNGHIGPIFGSWVLDEIQEDGRQLDMDEETVFSFQNEIVRVVKVVDFVGQGSEKFGNFTISDKELTLKFQAQPTESGSYLYVTPNWLHFPLDGRPIVFRIDQLDGSRMVLTLVEEGHTLRYSFRKTW